MLNEIMAEESQDANMEQGAVGLGENQVIQVNVELQDCLGLQAVVGGGGSIPLKWMRLKQR